VIDAEITIITGAGRSRDGRRLITTLTDPARFPADDLAVPATSAGKSGLSTLS
jgi:hypothetical protein